MPFSWRRELRDSDAQDDERERACLSADPGSPSLIVLPGGELLARDLFDDLPRLRIRHVLGNVRLREHAHELALVDDR